MDACPRALKSQHMFPHRRTLLYLHHTNEGAPCVLPGSLLAFQAGKLIASPYAMKKGNPLQYLPRILGIHGMIMVIPWKGLVQGKVLFHCLGSQVIGCLYHVCTCVRFSVVRIASNQI